MNRCQNGGEHGTQCSPNSHLPSDDAGTPGSYVPGPCASDS